MFYNLRSFIISVRLHFFAASPICCMYRKILLHQVHTINKYFTILWAMWFLLFNRIIDNINKFCILRYTLHQLFKERTNTSRVAWIFSAFYNLEFLSSFVISNIKVQCGTNCEFWVDFTNLHNSSNIFLHYHIIFITTNSGTNCSLPSLLHWYFKAFFSQNSLMARKDLWQVFWMDLLAFVDCLQDRPFHCKFSNYSEKFITYSLKTKGTVCLLSMSYIFR